MKRAKQLLVVSGFLALSFASFAPTDAAAQTPEPTNSRSTAFEAVEGANTEDVSGLGLMVASYGIIWLVIFGFLARVASIGRDTEAKIVELEKLLAEGETPG